jgi:SAM-dependent methyltransferase
MEPLLDLAEQPVGDVLLRESGLAVQEPTYPLGLVVCTSCWLLQLDPCDDAPDVSSAHGHGSSYSTATRAHEERWAEELIAQLGVDGSWRIVEVGSGDGSLLRYFARRGITVLGIEANPMAAAAARRSGVPTICAAFDLNLAQLLAAEGWSANLILANHLLPHVDDLDGCLAGIRTLMAPDGRFSTEFVHALQMVQQGQFDLVCHAHRYYLSLTALLPALARQDLAVVLAQEVAVHGGSLRILAGHVARRPHGDGTVDAVLQGEQAKGLTRLQTYRRLGDHATQVRLDLLGFLHEERHAGRSVAAYGAPTRGSTLLNFCGITPELIAFTVDRSPDKQGRYLPGSRLAIRPPDRIAQVRPDDLVILPWTLGDEIMEQLASIRAWGGRFVLPLPTLRVVG